MSRDEITCFICMEMLVRPVRCPGCHQPRCLHCLVQELEQVSKQCSFCRHYLRGFVRQNRGKLVDQQLWRRIKRENVSEISEREAELRDTGDYPGAGFDGELSGDEEHSEAEDDPNTKRRSRRRVSKKRPAAGSPDEQRSAKRRASSPSAPPRHVSAPGEIRQEFEAMLEKMHAEKRLEEEKGAEETYRFLLDNAPEQARAFRLQFLPHREADQTETSAAPSSGVVGRRGGGGKAVRTPSLHRWALNGSASSPPASNASQAAPSSLASSAGPALSPPSLAAPGSSRKPVAIGRGVATSVRRRRLAGTGLVSIEGWLEKRQDKEVEVVDLLDDEDDGDDDRAVGAVEDGPRAGKVPSPSPRRATVQPQGGGD